MIETKSYTLSKREFVKIVLLTRLRKMWWFFILFFVLGTYLAINIDNEHSNIFYVVFAFSYPIISMIWLCFWATAKDKKEIFTETEMSFDSAFLYLKRNENEMKIPVKNVVKVISNNKYWRLYLSNREFIYLEKDIFYSKEDYNQFCSLIISNN